MGNVNALPIAADHPAYSGHFPGAPLLPGVVLLDAALRQIASSTGTPASHWQIAAAKFHSPVGPGVALLLEQQPLPDGSLRFSIRSDGAAGVGGAVPVVALIVASGLLLPRPPVQEAAT